MSIALKLNTHDLVMLHTLLEVRATDLAAFIEAIDYGAINSRMRQVFPGSFEGDDDTRYLADIRAVQAKINAAI